MHLKAITTPTCHKTLSKGDSTDVDLTKDFWQYAIVRQEIIDKHLKHTKKYQSPCGNVVKEKTALSSEQYAEGQASNPAFKSYVASFQVVNSC